MKLSAIILFTLGLVGCASTSSSQFASIAREAKGHVGFSARVIETGEHLELNASDHFPMQSTYKTAIAMATLHQVDQGKLRLYERVKIDSDQFVPVGVHSPLRELHNGGPVEVSLRELIRYAISESDGSASDALLRKIGSLDAVMKFLHDIDVHDVIVATTEVEMAKDPKAQYRSWATPHGMVDLMIALHEARGLSQSSQSLLLQCMMASHNSNKRIKGLLSAGIEIAHKTGSSDTFNGITAATNDTGIITLPDGRHLAIAVFVSDSSADNDTREAVIARITRAAYDQITGETK